METPSKTAAHHPATMNCEHSAGPTGQRTYSITSRATVTVPEGTEELRARDGRIVGFKLKDGSILKPWIIMEHQPDPEADTYIDVNLEQLSALGFEGFDYGETEMETSVE